MQTPVIYFSVNKLQFEPPLRKETEARDEMVGIKTFKVFYTLRFIVSYALTKKIIYSEAF